MSVGTLPIDYIYRNFYYLNTTISTMGVCGLDVCGSGNDV